MNVIEKIAKAHYAATVADVEALASNVATGQQSDGTYLRVLVAATQAKLGTSRRGRVNTAAQLEILDQVHLQFYAAVQRGVGDASVDDAERRRRSGFARSAASTLRAYVKAGKDLRGLVVADTTKHSLRQAVNPVRQVPAGTSRVATTFLRSVDTATQAAEKLLASDGEEARETIESAIESLQNLLDASKPTHRAARTGARSTPPELRPH